jgi:DNA-directed RNA polymerase subunit RPC12/RpoP
MTSEERQTDELTEDFNYTEIIKSDTVVEPGLTKDSGEPTKIIYYCKDCKKNVAPKRIGKKLRFKCSECDSENVSFGTEKSVANYYNYGKK